MEHVTSLFSKLDSNIAMMKYANFDMLSRLDLIQSMPEDDHVEDYYSDGQNDN